MSRHNKTMSQQKMVNYRDKSSQVGRDKGFYVEKNISENDKIKVGNMLGHFQRML